jgi:ABC-2 type transport system permease protein
MLIGTHTHLLLDFGVMAGAVVLGIVTASSLVGRLAR